MIDLPETTNVSAMTNIQTKLAELNDAHSKYMNGEITETEILDAILHLMRANNAGLQEISKDIDNLRTDFNKRQIESQEQYIQDNLKRMQMETKYMLDYIQELNKSIQYIQSQFPGIDEGKVDLLKLTIQNMKLSTDSIYSYMKLFDGSIVHLNDSVDFLNNIILAGKGGIIREP